MTNLMTSPARPRAFGALAGTHELYALSALPDEGVYGLGVFAARFFEYLLRYGDFDEFHFFCLGLQGLGAAAAASPALLQGDKRVRVRPLHEFAKALDEAHFVALHNPWAPDIGAWIDLRNRLSRRPIPVTGLTHTISYQSLLPRTLLTMVLGMQPWDSLICTATSAVEVMRNWIEHLRGQFAGRLEAEFAGRLDKIPLAVDAEIFRRPEEGERRALRQRLALPQDAVLALYVGRFSPYDKMDLAPLLLAFKEAASEAAKQRQACALVLGGGDARFQYAAQVEELAAELGIAEAVHLRRDLAAADIARLYAAADIFVSPSDNLQETFGQTVIEAMAAALPVVCSDWDGYRDLVIHEQTGYLIPTRWQACDAQIGDYAGLWEPAVTHFLLSQTVSVDVEQMAAALSRLIGNAELRRQLGEQGRRRVLESFDWRVVIGSYLDLWEELNRQAARQPYAASPTSWYRPDFFATFKHYASEILEPTTVVRASDSAAAISWHRDLDGWLRPELLAAIAARAGQGAAVEELEKRLSREFAVSPERVRFHLLWMLKYDRLRRA